jgi:glycosyl transferase family 87
MMRIPPSGRARPMPADTVATQRPAEAVRRSLRLIGIALSVNTVLFLLVSFLSGQWLIDSAGRLADSDFVDVWAAGRLALDGHAAAAWDWTIHRDAEVAALGHDFAGNYGWHYPPTFLFAAVALATLPYLAASLGWLAVTLPMYVAAVRTIMGERLGILIACAFPAVMWNMLVGQNGFLTAALIGFALVCLDTRPVVAGVLLGLLTYKPQFGILFPVLLVANGQWRVIAAACATSAVLVAASAAVFGVAAWTAFFTWLPATSDIILSDGRAGLNKLQSLFGVLRWLGAGTTPAFAAQGFLIAACAAALVVITRDRRVPNEVKSAAIATGALLATPYLYIYDFPVLMIPLAFLLRQGLRDGFLAGELAAMATACGLVLVFPLVPVPIGFAAALVVAAVIGRRVVAERGSHLQSSLSSPGLTGRSSNHGTSIGAPSASHR